jgi:metallo-beta-lactamase class B
MAACDCQRFARTAGRVLTCVALVAVAAAVHAQRWPASWTTAQRPLQIFGNAYYVGPQGASAILVTSPDGHVLLDGPMQENAAMLVANIRALGFRIEDVKLIVNSHPHFDHAGAIAELQRLSGATVAARTPSAQVLTQGRSGPDDPQFGVVPDMPPVRSVRTIAAGETLRVGALALTAHETAGHTPGGTTWTWRSCQDGRCVDMVYADSLGAASGDAFLFTRNSQYPNVLRDFETSFATVAALPCDILVSAHPEVSNFWQRVARRDGGDTNALVDRTACTRYVESARAALKARVDKELKTR